MKEDRRIQKTKKILAEALRQLIMEKGYENVTVLDIIDRANVGRSTFYAHYENKEQLMLGNINFQRELIDAPKDDDEKYPMGINLTYLFEHTREHIKLAEKLLHSGGLDLVRDYFIDSCSARIREYHRASIPAGKQGRLLFNYKAEAAAAAVVAVLFKWLEEGATTPVPEMVECCREILYTLIKI